MRRSTIGRYAVAGVTVLTLAGCGNIRAGAESTATTPSPAATATAPSYSPAPRHISAELRKAEDSVCGTTTPPPSAEESSASPSTDAVEDRPPNYADNNAYRRALPLKGLAVCRGDVHVGRLTENLRSVPVDRAEVDAALSRLGYGYQVEQVRSTGQGVQFVIGLDGVCVTGTLLPTHESTIEAHGPYMEGGCVEPAYGH
ncbi:hypothetical protein ADK57_26430 [Streptomyces sp. MMG1533]|uniref:hypothetical protein n=1 Tax=Streptomyces sp. MMG1533 TaxID=1415546 RepID=UPI0006ADAC93|nr:hypothetical protein [Streptomyces sp. MMG1533]KOU61721.1 hypothetical protein ADK57_26430 [Streptomyces sp. MMG1533]